MNWFIISFVPPIFNSLVNYLDKYLISRFVKGGGLGSLIIFSALMGIPTLLLISFFEPAIFDISLSKALLLILNGSLFLASVIPYLHALERDEASIVSPLTQMATVISYVLGFLFLGEVLGGRHILAFILILVGSIFLTLEIQLGQKVRLKQSVLLLMLLASTLLATNGLIFKMVALSEKFWVVTFWEYVGFAVFAIVLFVFVKPYRKEFLEILTVNKTHILSLNMINEVLAISAKTALHFATLLAPLSLVFLVAEGFQPFFVLLFGVLITVFFPKLGEERLDKKYLLQKVVAISIMFMGTLFL